MELILWRHAEAAPGTPDATRALTGKGRRQAAKMGEWLNFHLPARCTILVSPATRTVQTAQALGRKFDIHPDLAPAATPEQILAAANWPHAKQPVLIVGHQPTLGQVAALLIAGVPQDWSMRKSNVWWISQKNQEDGNFCCLRAVMAPDLMHP
jgi:phosphohistidine phosphatase